MDVSRIQRGVDDTKFSRPETRTVDAPSISSTVVVLSKRTWSLVISSRFKMANK